mgnify:CR=1 FL=1
MNRTCVLCSGVVTAALGFMLGLAIAEMGQRHIVQENAHRLYGWVGAGIGLTVGASQETLRQKIHADQALGIVDDEPWRLN